jgi:RimJ/RimL family protein N-acetyltransferase
MEVITKTKRLIIAKFENRDVDLLYQLTSSHQVMKYFPKVLTYAETVQMIEKISAHYDRYGYCFWKLFLADYTFIGIAGLLHQEIEGNAETEISFRIKPEFWNQGYATEAGQACKTYAETVLNKKCLISIIHPKNIASKSVAEKLGAKKKDTTLFLGTVHELYVY